MDPVRSAVKLQIKATTWFKDSHSLYDYESLKNASESCDFIKSSNDLLLSAMRKKHFQSPLSPSKIILCLQTDERSYDQEEYETIARLEVRTLANNRLAVGFISQKKLESERMPTEESVSGAPCPLEEAYLIVSKMKNMQNEPIGHAISANDTVKLGRVQYFVSEICINNVLKTGKMQRALGKVMNYHGPPTPNKYSCKVCMEDVETQQNFICWPCKCLEETGAIHINCLKKWISVKVKSEVVGCTTHYNFQKFICQVCLWDFPAKITKNNYIHQILPIIKPLNNYMMLEGASQKTNSILLIENVPTEGIKIGRSHDCQIRIQDISVSRNHATIRFINNKFVIFDDRSKFGTLIKYPNMQIEINGKNSNGVQIGRTILQFQTKKIQNPIPTFKRNSNNDLVINQQRSHLKSEKQYKNLE